MKKLIAGIVLLLVDNWATFWAYHMYVHTPEEIWPGVPIAMTGIIVGIVAIFILNAGLTDINS